MKPPRLKTAVAALALFTLAAAAWSIAHAKSEEQVNRARFAADESATRPIEWRQWVRVGTRYKPIGLNILDQKLTKTPDILNAYVEPSAISVYKQAGQWPEGTQIIKEFTAIQVGPGCDTRPSFAAPGSETESMRAAIRRLARRHAMHRREVDFPGFENDYAVLIDTRLARRFSGHRVGQFRRTVDAMQVSEIGIGGVGHKYGLEIGRVDFRSARVAR